MLIYKELSDEILRAIFKVHSTLGSGLLEKPYHKALYHELQNSGLDTVYEQPYFILYGGKLVGHYFADLVVENKIIIEVKSVKIIHDIMKAQLINYLRISGLQVGYLVNFQGLSAEWERVINITTDGIRD